MAEDPTGPKREGLELIAEGSRDIAVGISGFGSAKMDLSRWFPLAEMTGRTTYVLHYDAQEMPWSEEKVPQSLFELATWGPELRQRWMAARLAAAGASENLAGWIRRWLAADRKVLVVGFSLGGFVAWRACREAAAPNLDVVLISAAIGDQPEVWRNADKLGNLINIYSKEDIVLKYLYPIVAESNQTPAAGLGALLTAPGIVDNIDATDMIEGDHLWASYHLDRLIRLSLACLWGARDIMGICMDPADIEREVDSPLSEEAYGRLVRWLVVDQELWDRLGKALDGDGQSIVFCRHLDRWSLQEDRLETLFGLGIAVRALFGSIYGREVAQRSYRQLSGMLRLWLTQTLPGSGKDGGGGTYSGMGSDSAGLAGT